MIDKRERLMQFVKEYGIVFDRVKLSSNIESDYYYDLKSVAFNPYGMDLLGDLLLEEVAKYNPKSVGGLEMGAIPLATAIAIKSVDRYDDGINPFVIRKNPKLHGLEKKIEGEVKAPVVIVEDVVTSGKSIYDAIKAVIDVTKLSVEGVVCVIDREEEGITNVLKEKHIEYSALFRHSEFKPFIEEKLRKNQQNLKIQPN